MAKKEEFFQRVDLIDYNDFRLLAKDENLSKHEKIGFPDGYRSGYTNAIMRDITGKLPGLLAEKKNIMDIGCGCDELAEAMIALAEKNHNNLYMCDSAEMCSLLPEDNIKKIIGKFPNDVESFIQDNVCKFDAILIYSVLMVVSVHDNIFNFIDRAVDLLAPGGRLLLGDIANRSKRRRFFHSNEGIETHKRYTGKDEVPIVNPWEIEYGRIDDSMVFAILQRYRMGGYETYLLPQNNDLPMANRREDILIEKRM